MGFTFLHRSGSATTTIKHNLLFSLGSLSTSITRFSTTSHHHKQTLIQPTPPSSDQSQERSIRNLNSRTRTPLEKQFETWIQNLKPGFTSDDVDEALRAQSDPDLALDIFRWTALQRSYKHNHVTYLTMLKMTISGKRYRVAETLVEEVLAGACQGSLPLYNSMVKFCCRRRLLFNRAFDVYKKMVKSEDFKPSLETYTLLLQALVNKFNKMNVCYVYLHAVRSLDMQMKAYGVIPDTFVFNMIIKAYSKCLQVDEAIRVFRDMGLYGCEPNEYTYGYIAKGLCEKGKVNHGLWFYKEMRKKELIPQANAYMILICSLAMEGRLDDAVEIVFDMLGNSMSPDLLTYKTLLEGLCREGKGNDAFDLLEELRKRDTLMNDKTYNNLLNALHFLRRE